MSHMFFVVVVNVRKEVPEHVNVRKEVPEHFNSFHPICKPVIAVDIFHTGATSISVKSG